MRYLLIFLTFLFSASLLSQTTDSKHTVYLKGEIYDQSDRGAIFGASVRILQQSDSSYVHGTVTDSLGHFSLTLPEGKYIGQIVFLGYKPFSKNIDLQAGTDTYNYGKIYLDGKSITLGEAEIAAEIPPVVVKGDTIEYNASSYNLEESAILQDLVRKMPGVEVDGNGNITANGKPVQKILVDGKEFFGNDIVMALNNLPANMIKKLQLFKEDSDNAKVTGFKDKNPSQVLNLVVKEEMKRSIFGDIKLGGGSDEKYSNKVMLNYMQDDNQASVVGDLNNVGNSEYGSGGNGTTAEKNVGGSFYSQGSDKLRIGGNIRYSRNDNTVETNSSDYTISLNQYQRQQSFTKNTRNDSSIGMNLQWSPDSLTTVYLRTNMGQDKSKRFTHSTTQTEAQNGVSNDTTTSFFDDKGYNMNNTLTIGRKLNSQGRTLSLSVNNTYRNNEGNGINHSNVILSANRVILDQKIDTENKTNNVGATLSYVEPLGEDRSFMISYSINKNSSKRIKNTWKQDNNRNYTVIDSAYTRTTRSNYINQNITLAYQESRDKFNYTIGFGLDPSHYDNRVNLLDSIVERFKQNVLNFSPNLHFTYSPNSSTSFDFDYTGSTTQPTITQLSADTVIVNTLTKNYGNTGLKPSYENNINMYFQKSDYEKNRFLMITGGFRYIFNNIVDYTIIDDDGVSYNTFKNVNGNLNTNLGIMYNSPLGNKKLMMSTNSYFYHTKNIGFTNSRKTVTNYMTLSEQLSLRYSIDKFETSLSGNISHNITRNNINDSQNRNTTKYGGRYDFFLKLPLDITLQSDIEYTRYVGYGDGFKSKEVLWNLSASKLFLKQKKGTVRLQLFDILDERNNQIRSVESDKITEVSTNTINQYFLLSFSYRFNIIKGGNKTQGDVDDSYDLGF